MQLTVAEHWCMSDGGVNEAEDNAFVTPHLTQKNILVCILARSK